jgi:hypothetical protein
LTYLIEYLGEFEFIFKTVLGYVSGDQMGNFEAKKTESKISRLGTFKLEQVLTEHYCEVSNIKYLISLRTF